MCSGFDVVTDLTYLKAYFHFRYLGERDERMSQHSK